MGDVATVSPGNVVILGIKEYWQLTVIGPARTPIISSRSRIDTANPSGMRKAKALAGILSSDTSAPLTTPPI